MSNKSIHQIIAGQYSFVTIFSMDIEIVLEVEFYMDTDDIGTKLGTHYFTYVEVYDTIFVIGYPYKEWKI